MKHDAEVAAAEVFSGVQRHPVKNWPAKTSVRKPTG